MTFDDGVVVVVDSKAKWMRVEPVSKPGGAPLAVSVTYDLRKDTTGERSRTGEGGTEGKGGSAGDARGKARRMPRDVKERMKALPRFIAVLRKSSAAPASAVGKS